VRIVEPAGSSQGETAERSSRGPRYQPTARAGAAWGQPQRGPNPGSAHAARGIQHSMSQVYM
jgi:hypothetical protein